MAKKNNKKRSKTKSIVKKINADDAFTILKILAAENKNIGKRIEQIAKEYLSKVDIEDVAYQVYHNLDSLNIGEVDARSGTTGYGYIEPENTACEIFEEALKPFLENLKKYQKLSMDGSAKNYCKGIIEGIYRFEKESKSNYKGLLGDTIWEYLGWVLDSWKKHCRKVKDKKEIEEFVNEYTPDL